MKRILIAAGFFLTLQSFAQTNLVKQPARGQTRLSTSSDSLQYTLGAFLGQWVINNGFTVTNPELLRMGINDVLLQKPLMVNPASLSKKLDTYQKQQLSERSNKQEKLLFENLNGKVGVGKLPSGVAYVVMKAGNGVRPQPSDSILIHIKGTLPEGKIFENTYAKQAALRTTPGTLIKGINEVLQIMPAGSTWRLFVPSSLGYGEKGIAGIIPPHSALIFEIELINILK